MRKITKGIFILIFCVIIANNVPSKAATFDDINQDSVFLDQQGKSTCTLVASAMMMRRAAILSGDNNWTSITESSLKSSAWVTNVGLKWSFSYAGISVASAQLPTGQANVNILINLLAQHPEGIVLHYKGAPHAVLLTDYTDGVFYCSDPLKSKGRTRIPLSKAYKVTATNATRYWYVSSPDCYFSQQVDAPSGYEITINKTLLTVKENLVATLNPYDNNVTGYTFVILKNGSLYKTIANGASRTLSYNIDSPGSYQIYGSLTNEGGSFSGSPTDGCLSFEVTDQILTGLNISCDGNPDGFEARAGITINVSVNNNIKADNFKFEIYKKNDSTSKYEYSTIYDNGNSGSFYFHEPAGDYRVKVIASNRVGSIADSIYIKALSDSVSGVNIKFESDNISDFLAGLNKTIKLNAVIKPDFALNKNVTWNSSNPDVAKVDKNGNLSSVGYGFSLITVRTEDGNFTSSVPIKINGFGFQYGDVDSDGFFTAADLADFVKYADNDSSLSEHNKKIMDLDGDGRITSEDVEMATWAVLGEQYIFPVESDINNISIKKLPNKTQYKIGEKLDLTGLELQVQYNSGVTDVITDGYTFVGNTDSAGERNIIISYCEDEIVKTAQFSINVQGNGTAEPTPTPTPSPTPSGDFTAPSCTHLFNDYNYTIPVSGSPVIIYGNGGTFKTGTTKTTNKQFIAYTDILASYNYSLNAKGVVKPSAGKVIVGITKSNVKPVVTKNKIIDKDAAKIARAKIKNGQITVTAAGKEKGLVYLWIIDTGNKGVYESCPINVLLAPKKLEVCDTAGNKLKSPKLENGKTLDVNVTGIVSGNTKTDDCTYTATVASNSQNYISVVPSDNSGKKFTIKATGLKNNKNTKVTVIFQCNENNKKAKFALTITK